MSINVDIIDNNAIWALKGFKKINFLGGGSGPGGRKHPGGGNPE